MQTDITKPTLSLARAHRITTALAMFGWRAAGHTLPPGIIDLRAITLSEMIEAGRIIAAHDAQRHKQTGEGKSSITVTDEHIAAVYLTINGQPDATKLLTISEDGQSALMLLPIDHARDIANGKATKGEAPC